MRLETGGQRVTALAIVLAFLAVLALVVGWIVTSLSERNVTALGTEAYASAIATAEGKPTGDQAAEVLRTEAKGHNLEIAV